MSPASSGHLEVERYIGACLISQHRSKTANILNGNNKQYHRDHFYGSGRGEQQPQQFIPDVFQGNYVNLDGRFRIQRCNSVDGWAGGMPLISFANHQRRGGRQLNDLKCASSTRIIEDHHQPSPLAQLAVHTQGAPLILTKSYNHRKNKVHRNNNNNNNNNNVVHKSFDSTTRNKGVVIQGNKCQIENSGQNNGVDAVSVASDESSGSANSENCLPRIIKPRKRRKKDRKPPLLGRPLSQDGFSTDSASPDIDNTPTAALVNLRPFIPFEPYTSYRVPDLIDRYDISETPNLHHSFEDIEEEVDDGKDVNGNQPTSICQCRYCDPSGQIWDVDRNCYSPFLTPPNSDSRTFQFPNVKLPNLVNVFSENCLVHSMSSVSLDEDSGVVKKVVGPRSSGDLEVSTEIVTSLNGHRDLEIKFFSSPSVESDEQQKECGDECVINCAVNTCTFTSEE